MHLRAVVNDLSFHTISRRHLSRGEHLRSAVKKSLRLRTPDRQVRNARAVFCSTENAVFRMGSRLSMLTPMVAAATGERPAVCRTLSCFPPVSLMSSSLPTLYPQSAPSASLVRPEFGQSVRPCSCEISFVDERSSFICGVMRLCLCRDADGNSGTAFRVLG